MSKKDPYIYENSETLINKFNIRDAEILNKLESDIIPGRILSIKRVGFQIHSVFDIKEIHRFLFSPIYTWAGEFRTITIYKREPILKGASVDYTPHAYISKEMNDLEKEFLKIDWEELSDEEKIKKICYIIQQLWQIHCFREGNTRTIVLFLYFLMKNTNLKINSTFISKHSKYFRNALVLASCYSRSKPEYLYGIIKDATTIPLGNDHKYKSINGYNVDRYRYSYHTILKLESISNLQELEKDKR